MPHYIRMGQVPPKRHTQFRKPDGSLYHEEVIGSEGFSGISSIAYHVNSPTLVDRIGKPVPFGPEYGERVSLRHIHIRGLDIASSGAWLEARRYAMGNADVRLGPSADRANRWTITIETLWQMS